MRIIQWQRHGDVLIGIDNMGWKRAVIFWEDNLKYYGYAPLGEPSLQPIQEFSGTNLRRLQKLIAGAIASKRGDLT